MEGKERKNEGWETTMGTVRALLIRPRGHAVMVVLPGDKELLGPVTGYEKWQPTSTHTVGPTPYF